MKRLLVALLLCWTATATPLRAVDGDTFDAMVAVWPSSIPKHALLVPERIRVLGVNAPERHGATKAAGDAARDFTQAWLEGADVRLYACQRDAFGRLLATVTRARDGANLGDDLIRDGKAVPYKP